MQHPKPPYDRASRIATEIHQVIASYCQERLSDPRLQGVQITAVRVSRDLRVARVNFFLRGTPEEREACVAGLRSASGALKRALGEQLVLKFMPELHFHFDDAIEQGERVGDLIEKLEREHRS